MTDITALTRAAIRDMSAYHVEPFPARIILDANESPYPLPEKMRERFAVLTLGTDYNRYPDPEATPLRKTLARKEGCDPSEIIFGNGSDELILAIIATFCDPGESILVPSPTFSMYRQIARYFGVGTKEVGLSRNFSLNIEAMLEQIEKERPKIVWLASPNNPTGDRFEPDHIDKIIEAAPGLVVIDEAYIDFGDDPSIGLRYKKDDNVVILRTFSKVGFAALRLGFMMADQKVIEQVNKVRLPFNVNSLTQALCCEMIKHWELLLPNFSTIRGERHRVSEALTDLDVTVFPSQANFVLIHIPGLPEKNFARLLSFGIRVRWFENHPRLHDCFRVTIGTPAENSAFLAAVRKIG